MKLEIEQTHNQKRRQTDVHRERILTEWMVNEESRVEGIVFKVVKERKRKKNKGKKRIREEIFASKRVFSEILSLIPIWQRRK